MKIRINNENMLNAGPKLKRSPLPYFIANYISRTQKFWCHVIRAAIGLPRYFLMAHEFFTCSAIVHVCPPWGFFIVRNVYRSFSVSTFSVSTVYTGLSRLLWGSVCWSQGPICRGRGERGVGPPALWLTPSVLAFGWPLGGRKPPPQLPLSSVI